MGVPRIAGARGNGRSTYSVPLPARPSPGGETASGTRNRDRLLRTPSIASTALQLPRRSDAARSSTTQRRRAQDGAGNVLKDVGLATTRRLRDWRRGVALLAQGDGPGPMSGAPLQHYGRWNTD